MVEPDWSPPLPNEITLWRGERPPTSLFLIISFSVITTGVGLVVSYYGTDLRAALLNPISLVLYGALIGSVLPALAWSRTEYEITTLRASVVTGSRRSDILLHDLSSVTVEKGSWTGGIDLASIVVRAAGDELRLTWILNSEDAVASLGRVMRSLGRELQIVRHDRRCQMYVPVESRELAASAKPLPSVPSLPEGAEERFRIPLSTFAGPLIAVVVLAAFLVAGYLRKDPIQYPANDAIYPNGVKRSTAEIVAFMKAEVLPFAKKSIGPLVGGEDEVTCETCHGDDAEERGYRMPAVKALPEPKVLEMIGDGLRESDSQVQTAVYGYLASPEKLATMRVMREVVLPGMSDLLGRPAYDFTKPLAHNRRNFAFGCYHCHRLDDRSK